LSSKRSLRASRLAVVSRWREGSGGGRGAIAAADEGGASLAHGAGGDGAGGVEGYGGVASRPLAWVFWG